LIRIRKYIAENHALVVLLAKPPSEKANLSNL
jgi:hypothetical protein